MTEISQNTLFEILDVDFASGLLYWKPRPKKFFQNCKLPHRAEAIWNARYAGKRAFTIVNRHGYLSGRIFSKGYLAHRVIWIMAHGVWPKIIDHKNRQPSDNRLCNLREATHSQNGANMKRGRKTSSDFYGISWVTRDGKWTVRVRKDGRVYCGGNFDSEIDAAIARDALAKKLQGEFAILNFMDGERGQ